MQACTVVLMQPYTRVTRYYVVENLNLIKTNFHVLLLFHSNSEADASEFLENVFSIRHAVWFDKMKPSIQLHNNLFPVMKNVILNVFFIIFQSLIIVRLPLSQAAQCKKDAATAAGFGGRFLGVGGKVSRNNYSRNIKLGEKNVQNHNTNNKFTFYTFILCLQYSTVVKWTFHNCVGSIPGLGS